MIDYRLFKKAVDLARRYYKNKTDGSGTLIFDHCFRVAIKLKQIVEETELEKKEKESIIIAGLFHDLIEDTSISKDEILFFGENVLDYTKQMTLNFKNGIKNAVKPLYNVDDEVFLIKLTDIFDNVSKSFFMIRKNGLGWYYDFFLPLLGEYKILIEHRRKNLKNNKLKKIIYSFSKQVLDKIKELNKFINLNKELRICE